MSDTVSMVRLMEHANDLLLASCDQIKGWTGGTEQLQRERSNAIAAMAYGRAVLQMVAASVSPEGTRIASRIRSEYATWAEAMDGVSMSPGELESIARFVVEDGAK